MLAYQLSSFLLYVYLYAKLLHMPAANSVVSISLYVCRLEQSFAWACYMPACMPNIHYAKFYVFAHICLFTCYNIIVSMPVDISSSVYMLDWDMPSALSHMLWVSPCIETTIAIYCDKSSICFIPYAMWYMPAVICQGSYASLYILSAMC
jgi:hypothetical protein